MFQKYVDRQPDALSNLNLCQHVINTFTIPFGVIVDRDATGKTVSSESTQWVTFRDVTNRMMYFNTYENPDLRRIVTQCYAGLRSGIQNLRSQFSIGSAKLRFVLNSQFSTLNSHPFPLMPLIVHQSRKRVF